MKNVVYTITSNLVSLVISTLITCFAPKVISIETYSWFQLYLFYTTYISVFTLGWGEGIYLRYGGEYYETLDKDVFGSQFRIYICLEILISCLIVLASLTFKGDKCIVFLLVGIVVSCYAPCLFFRNLLLSVNMIKEYAITHIVEKIVYGVLCIISLRLFPQNYLSLICADIIGKLIADLYIFSLCKEVLRGKQKPFFPAIKEVFCNISAGSKLLASNLLGLFIIGVARYAIQSKWGITIFGKISLTISVSNFLMVFIRAVAAVMFPLLRRTNSSRQHEIYAQIRTTLMVFLLGMLIFYYPLEKVLLWWLPSYADSLRYIAILLPMCVFESKMSMLIETYLKTLREEKWLLFINMLSVLISFALSYIAVFILDSMEFALLSIVLVIAFRAIASELYLAPKMKININVDLFYELVVTSGFIILHWMVRGVVATIVYSLLYILYIILKKKEIHKILKAIWRK